MPSSSASRRADDDPGETYAAVPALLDELRVRLLARDVTLRDRLDAQGIVWMLAKG